MAWLAAAGYRREHQVEHRGEVAVRGGIIDVFPSTADVPVRIDLWGDEVDRLTTFDVGDQRSIVPLESVSIFGCRELLPSPARPGPGRRAGRDRALGPGPVGALGRGPGVRRHGVVAAVATPGRPAPDRPVAGRGPGGAGRAPPGPGPGGRAPRRGGGPGRGAGCHLGVAPAGADGEGARSTGADVAGQAAERFPRLYLPFDRLLARSRPPSSSLAPVAEGPDVPAVTVRGFEPVAGDAARLARQVTALVSDGYSVTLCSATAGGAARLSGVLAEEGVTAPVADGGLVVGRGTGGGGPARLRVRGARGQGGGAGGVRRDRAPDPAPQGPAPGPTDRRLLRRPGARQLRGAPPARRGPLRRGHHPHGGRDHPRLPGARVPGQRPPLPAGGPDRGGHPLQRGETPTLSKMGGADWQRARAKARAAASEIAEELVDLYRRRLAVEGHAFPPDTPWQRELESAFPFVETADQLRAIDDVKADMEQPRPMDRLVCGDVGFGKTEVAVRAVFKAVQDGKQAAVLVPTTLLASQHYQTFADRFGGFPVRVEMLSRFLSNAQARKVVEGLADGSVDVVVGTHRLLAQDIAFKDLGLLVVDEEQRFGVTHKEAVKRLAEGVDVLTLTASPIPRTLEMALTGIRDLSMVNTPPADRRPILTYVGEYEEAAVSEAIRRELLREGQVFYVHNRVADIEAVARRLGALVPEARIAVAHGQMDEGSLEQVVLDFWERGTTCWSAPPSSSRASTCPR